MNDKRFEQLLTSIDEMKAHRRGEVDLPPENIHFVGEPDPREVRNKMELSRSDFAHVLGVSERTLEGWEQGRRSPSGPAVQLLKVAAKRPDVLLEIA